MNNKRSKCNGITMSNKVHYNENKYRNKCISDGLMHVTTWHRWTPESKFTKFREEMSIGQTPNHAKFCGYLTRTVRDICAPENVGQNSPNSLKTCYPLKPPIVPNFFEISETTLEKSVMKIFTPFNILAP